MTENTAKPEGEKLKNYKVKHSVCYALKLKSRPRKKKKTRKERYGGRERMYRQHIMTVEKDVTRDCKKSMTSAKGENYSW